MDCPSVEKPTIRLRNSECPCGNVSVLRSSAIKSACAPVVGIENSVPITPCSCSVPTFVHAPPQQVMSPEPLSAALSQESRILIPNSRTRTGLSPTISLASRSQSIHVGAPLGAAPAASRASRVVQNELDLFWKQVPICRIPGLGPQGLTNEIWPTFSLPLA